MHLLNAMSLAGGQSIGKVELYETYFPLPFNDKYIVFAPVSKDSKTYDYWNDVLSIIGPILNKKDIKILQIGANGERPYNHCFHLMGATTINQTAYLIKNSLGVLSTDTFAQHIADAYGIKSVVLISNNYVNNVRGYFNPDKQIVLEPIREANEKPCLSLQEIPKSINRIKPEDIVAAFCQTLGLPFDFPYQTIYNGEISIANMIISTCDIVYDNRQFNIPSLIVDLTLGFNEEILLKQMLVCEVSLVTNKALSDNVFNHHKQTKRIKEMIYEITEEHDVNFARKIIKNGIPLRLVSKLPQEKVDILKLDYMDIGVIWPIQKFNPKEILELKELDLSKLFFKSSRLLLNNGKAYGSKAHLINNIPMQTFDDILPIIDAPEFWENLDSYKILQKKV